MEFNQKLQELRKQKGITQEQLASALFVSRTAISKWESGRGYPNIDSLRQIAGFFGVTIDELLRGEELLSIAEQESRQNANVLHDIIFGLSDISAATILFLPFFGQNMNGTITTVSLLHLTQIPYYLRISYFAIVIGIILFGVLTLSLQKINSVFWRKNKELLSLILNAVGLLLFIVSSQPYAAVFLFIFLAFKVILLAKKR